MGNHCLRLCCPQFASDADRYYYGQDDGRRRGANSDRTHLIEAAFNDDDNVHSGDGGRLLHGRTPLTAVDGGNCCDLVAEDVRVLGINYPPAVSSVSRDALTAVVHRLADRLQDCGASLRLFIGILPVLDVSTDDALGERARLYGTHLARRIDSLLAVHFGPPRQRPPPITGSVNLTTNTHPANSDKPHAHSADPTVTATDGSTDASNNRDAAAYEELCLSILSDNDYLLIRETTNSVQGAIKRWDVFPGAPTVTAVPLVTRKTEQPLNDVEWRRVDNLMDLAVIPIA